MFRAAVVLTVLPVVVAALRNGLAGWYPVGDAATTAVRVNDVFTRNIPLVGMWSSASDWAGRPINFPGALQLYLLAVPVRVLGDSWGVLVGMATLNVAALVTACWLIRRRVGYRLATLGCAFLASFTWTLGSEVLIDITPMQMVVVPTILLFVAAWAVADADLAALPVLAFVANYLFLDHLTLVALVPITVAPALVLLAARLRSLRRSDGGAWAVHRRRLWRALGASLALTLLAWTPPLIEQFATSAPHNLTNLYEASKATPPVVQSWSRSTSAVGATIASPPWWFRPTFRSPAFNVDGTGRPAVLVIGCSVALAAAYLVAAWVAWRRKQHTIVSGLVLGATSVLAVLVTTKKSTNPLGLMPSYLHCLWPASVFVWMMLAFAGVRLLATVPLRAHARHLQGVALAAAAVWCALAIPRSTQLTNDWPHADREVKAVLAQTVPAVRGKGPVLVLSSLTLEAGMVRSGLLLGLQDAGVPLRLAGDTDRYQYGERRAYRADPPNATQVLYVTSGPSTLPGSKLLATTRPTMLLSEQERSRADRTVHEWLAQGRPLRVDPTFAHRYPTFAKQLQQTLDEMQATATRTGRPVSDDLRFVSVAAGSPYLEPNAPWIDTTGIDPGLLQRWAQDRYRIERQTINVYLAPIQAYRP